MSQPTAVGSLTRPRTHPELGDLLRRRVANEITHAELCDATAEWLWAHRRAELEHMPPRPSIDTPEQMRIWTERCARAHRANNTLSRRLWWQSVWAERHERGDRWADWRGHAVSVLGAGTLEQWQRWDATHAANRADKRPCGHECARCDVMRTLRQTP